MPANTKGRKCAQAFAFSSWVPHAISIGEMDLQRNFRHSINVRGHLSIFPPPTSLPPPQNAWVLVKHPRHTELATITTHISVACLLSIHLHTSSRSSPSRRLQRKAQKGFARPHPLPSPTRQGEEDAQVNHLRALIRHFQILDRSDSTVVPIDTRGDTTWDPTPLCGICRSAGDDAMSTMA